MVVTLDVPQEPMSLLKDSVPSNMPAVSDRLRVSQALMSPLNKIASLNISLIVVTLMVTHGVPGTDVAIEGFS
jgi:hypothetical protein